MRGKHMFLLLTICLLALAGVYAYQASRPELAGSKGPAEATGEPHPQTAERGDGTSTFPQDRADGSTSPASYTQLNYQTLRVLFILAMIGCAGAGYYVSTRRDVPGHG